LGAGCCSKPIADDFCYVGDLIVMGLDILSGDIGDKFLIPEKFRIQYEAVFLSLACISEAFRAQEQTQFQGHIKAREIGRWIDLGSRNIMDSIFAFRNNSCNFFDSDFAAVRYLKCASYLVSAVNH